MRRCVLVVLLVGCAANREKVSAHESAIIGGVIDENDPAVVAVIDTNDAAGCTGTLIAPSIVLTAAHCVTNGTPASVYFGSHPTVEAPKVDVAWSVAAPSFDPTTGAHDLGILVLRTRASVPPIAITWDAHTVGERVRVVGFGVTDTGGAIAKHMGESAISEVHPSSFRVTASPALPCHGDSGGPALRTIEGVDVVGGVVSKGDDACESYADIQTIGSERDLIEPFLPGAASLGARCFYDEHCKTGRCRPSSVAKFGYCTSACSRDADCAAGMTCSDGSCTYLGPSPGALGSSCSESSECDLGLCARPSADRPNVCSELCFPEDPQPSGFVCSANPDQPGKYALFAGGAAPESTGCGMPPRRRSGRTVSAILLFAACVLARRVARR